MVIVSHKCGIASHIKISLFTNLNFMFSSGLQIFKSAAFGVLSRLLWGENLMHACSCTHNAHHSSCAIVCVIIFLV